MVPVPLGQARSLHAVFDAPLAAVSTVTVHAFRLSQDEVSNADYQQCVHAGRCPPIAHASDDPDLPVTRVNWSEAAEYCHAIGERLPTEMEWRRVAFPPDGSRQGRPLPHLSPKYDICDVLVIGGDDGDRCPHPRSSDGPEATIFRQFGSVGAGSPEDRADVEEDKEGNESTIFDLYGNVSEWEQDDASADERLMCTTKGVSSSDRGYTLKVIRGGNFASTEGDNEQDCWCAPPSWRSPDVGFRCASN